jgi:RNA polymerase sigma-70 factor (ECF subfamily)
LANVVSFEALSSDTYKVEFPADGPPVGENLERRELIEHIQRILDKLPVKYKTVLVLRDLEGLHCREIAKVVHCSYPTLRWRLFQARKLFKAAWEREFRLEKDFQRHIPKRATGKSL